MRKAIFVVALIAASFAGGAVVNGPGLAWAQKMIVKQLGGSSPLTSDAAVPPSVEEIPTVEEPPGGAIPSAPLPPLVASPSPKPVPFAAPLSPPAAEPEGPALVGHTAQAAPETAPQTKPSRSSTTNSPVDVPAPPAPTSESGSLSALPKGPGSLFLKETPTSAEAAQWRDAPGSAPARAVLPGQAPINTIADASVTTAALTPGAKASSAGSWTDVRRRLRVAGVTRYWIEGETNGPVHLRCLVPEPGQRAVGRQFEGEGDDELQAAESALRRIALWKATETP